MSLDQSILVKIVKEALEKVCPEFWSEAIERCTPGEW